MEKKTDFKALSNKAKVQYIWDYYKLHILFGGVIAAIVIGLGYHFITYRKPVLSVIMINVQTTSENAEARLTNFLMLPVMTQNSSQSMSPQIYSFPMIQMQQRTTTTTWYFPR